MPERYSAEQKLAMMRPRSENFANIEKPARGTRSNYRDAFAAEYDYADNTADASAPALKGGK